MLRVQETDVLSSSRLVPFAVAVDNAHNWFLHTDYTIVKTISNSPERAENGLLQGVVARGRPGTGFLDTESSDWY
ncbi:hypothetical protein TNCV_1970131 [Trichonephila clavipes]|nr:hypothetical protein TNCV_1970131 [Trichonephila clavipes]